MKNISKISFFVLITALFLVLLNSCNKSEVKPSNPTITSISDALAPVDYQIVIIGTNFSTTASENVVKFNGTQADVLMCSAGSITTQVPAGATTGPVTVTVKGVTVTGPVITIYVPGVISDVNPVCGPSGTEITITGSGFETNPNNLQVWFGVGTDAKQGTLVSATSTEIKAIVPNGLSFGFNADVNVKITHIVFSAIPMSVAQANPGPARANGFAIAPFILIDFTPKSGARGSTVTITGTGFAGVPADFLVGFFNAPTTFTDAEITSVTDTAITVTVTSDAISGEIFVGRPGGASGPFPGAYFKSAFTVTP